MNIIDAHLIRRELVGHTLNGELAAASATWRPVLDVMNPKPPTERLIVWEGALALRPDRDEIRKAVMAANPNAPMPTVNPVRFANLGDVRRQRTTTGWTWQGWIPSARIVGVAALEGVGKTRFFMDLARRVWNGLEWPDGQAATFPAGTKTLWLCSDGHQDELVDIAGEFGLPDEAILFPTPDGDPYDNTDLDDKATWDWLDRAMSDIKPGLTFIDTLTYATTRDLCDQRSVAGLKPQLVGMVQKHQANIVLSLHLSQQGQALGRRIKGLTRTLIHMECPCAEKSERLRLWVEKSYDKKPPALGVTIKADGNDYDFNPPVKAEAKGGRPPEKVEKAIAFLVEKLTDGDEKACDLIREWEGKGESKSTIFRAKDQMVDEGRIVVDDTKKPQIWHLVL